MAGTLSAQACTALFTPDVGEEYSCLFATQSFSADSINGTWNYSWSTSSNGSILSGQGTPYVTVVWNSQAGGNFVSLSINTPQPCFDTQFWGDSVHKAIANIMGPQSLIICDTNQVFLYHTSSPACLSDAATPTWTIFGGTIVNFNNDTSNCVAYDSVWVKWGTGGIGWLELEMENNVAGCTDLDTVNANLFPKPLLNGPIYGCLNDTNGLYFTQFHPGKAYFWAATNGNVVIPNGAGPNERDVVWTSTGIGNIRVIEDNSGCLVEDTIVVEIAFGHPIADFSYSVNGLSVFFTNSTSGNPSSFHWDFGDGNTSNMQYPTHVYAGAGTYTACLIAVNGCGADTICKMINLCPVPNAGFGSFINGASVTFIDTTQYSPTNWFWTFGDNDSSFAQNPTHVYITPGTYNVCLIASSACGSDTTCDSITVACDTPKAAYSYNQLGLTLILYDSSEGAPTSYLWTFGDGDSSTVSGPFHLYAVADTYEVCMYVDNLCGSDSFCQDIIVPCSSPFAGFTAADTVLTVTFANNSFNGNAYSWDFGDGNTSTQYEPQHVYSISGTYHVCLNVSNPCGNSVFCQDVTVGCPSPPPLALSPGGPLYACGGDTIYVYATPGYDSYDWSNGDTTDVLCLTGPGTFVLTITDTNNCVNKDTVVSYIGFENVEWEQFVGSYQSQDTLYRIPLGNSWGSTGAVSTQIMDPNTDGTMRHIIHNRNLTYYIGLTENNIDASPTDMDYSFFIRRNEIWTRQFNQPKISFGGINPGDVLEIRRVGSVIEWLKNGTVLVSVSDNANRALRVDCSIFKQNNYITSTSVDFCTPGGYIPPLEVTYDLVHNSCETGPDGAISLNVTGGVSPYSYNWSSGDTTASIIGKSGNLFTVTITDAQQNTQMLSIDMWNRVSWTELENTSSNIDTLTRTLAGSSWGDCGGRSVQVLQPNNNGFMAHIVGATNKYYYIGFANSNPDASQLSIDYSFYNAKGVLYIREETGYFQTHGTVAPGDALRIDRIGNTIEYRKNGVLIKTSSTIANDYLFVDATLFSSNTKLHDVFGGHCTSFYPPPFLEIVGTVTHEECDSANGAISVAVSQGTPPYTYLWNTAETNSSITGKTAGSYNVIVTDNGGYIDTMYYEIMNYVNWEGFVSASASNHVLSRIGTSNGPWGSSGARSDNILLGGNDGRIVHPITSIDYYYYLGFSADDVDAGPTTIDYSIYNAKGGLKIREEHTGYNQWFTGVTLEVGDEIVIERINSTIYYYLNGGLLRNVTVNSMDTLMVDVSMYTDGTVIDKVLIDFCDNDPTNKWNSMGQEGGTALTSEGHNDLLVYPNPARDHLTIDFGTSELECTGVELMDVMGRIMLWKENQDHSAREIDIPLGQMAEGVYFLRIHNPEGYVVRKVEIIH